jgi:hypothetical protein
MANTFRACSNLVNAPVIPNSVTNMANTFRGCSNLECDIIIQATEVSSLGTTFAETNASKVKNVKCWKYENGVDSNTYTRAVANWNGKNGVTVTSIDGDY